MTCLVYLMRFDSPDSIDEDMMKRNLDVVLALYAAQHWISHVHRQGPDVHQPLQSLAKEFFHLPW